MKRRVLIFGWLMLASVIWAAEPSTDYVRFVEGDEGDSLETAVVRFESPQKVVVDLVGAIHIADKSYYDALNSASAVTMPFFMSWSARRCMSGGRSR